jgi:hypothetical protein
MPQGPDLEPTPLRLRLGHRVDGPVGPRVDDTIASDRRLEATDQKVGTDAIPASVEAPNDIAKDQAKPGAPGEEVEELRLPRSWHQQLEQAAEQSAQRMDRWIVQQRRRLADGLDNMLIQLEQARQAELARIEAWKVSELSRVEEEVAAERERFHAHLLQELMAFEEQLGLRIQEQEERLARWWDEAEQMAAKRFAAVGFDPRSKSAEEGPRPS